MVDRYAVTKHSPRMSLTCFPPLLQVPCVASILCRLLTIESCRQKSSCRACCSSIMACLQVYREALASPACMAVHLTHIDDDFECDTALDGFDPAAWRTWSASPHHKHKGLGYSFHCYVRLGSGTFTAAPKAMASKHEEQQVLRLIPAAALCLGIESMHLEGPRVSDTARAAKVVNKSSDISISC